MNIDQNQPLKLKTPIIAIASGKGGVGKTSFTLNTATALAKKGKRVLVFDADLGLGNVDVQLGLSPEKDLSHVMRELAEIDDIILSSGKGFDVIPGRSGSEKLPFLNAIERRDILKNLRRLAQNYDAVLLDVAAGVNDEVLAFANFADTTALVVTPDPSSITDAYAVVKLLKNIHARSNCKVVVNMASSTTEGKLTYEKMKMAAENFLKVQLPLLGVVPLDREYSAAVKLQKVAVEAFPQAKSAMEIDRISKLLLG